MFKRGFACCVLLALVSTAYGGVRIDLIPNPPPPSGGYNGGETVIFDVFLVQDPPGSDRSLRMVQLDMTDTMVPNWGAPTGGSWDFSSTPHCASFPMDCGADHYIDEDRFTPLPPAENVFVIAFGSEAELGENTDKQLVLPGDGTPVRVGQLRVNVPVTDGHYMLDVMNDDETAMDMGAQVHWGFGTNVNGEPLTVWRPSMLTLTGGEYDVCVGDADPPCPTTTAVAAFAATPACDVSLTRPSNSVMRIEFCEPITAPAPGEIEVRELLAGGALGADLSASLVFSVEGGNVLRIAEAGAAVLANETWYGVMNTGGWAGVSDFKVDYRVVFGDANNSGFTNFADLSVINANLTGSATDWDLNDINASGFVNFADLSAAFARNGATAPAKPSGHACNLGTCLP